ncbi:hypothetical protein LEP1GSC132_2008 [Leptospira kirschneri str. 200803703]|uniref:Uncharacterized protein n=1 Tax=Leptospira kirschneri str. 200802841 TaxID=1193047 RepID=A0A828Y5H4_9LEPT|nr:hypothetical protein LEP1GSC131_3651 [Leptospira kirschneri str. 200802841]EMO65626.1 hypothetical protein LEP1GSC132_2008 [Leptospira kirschneri str. 200803703]
MGAYSENFPIRKTTRPLAFSSSPANQSNSEQSLSCRALIESETL